MLDEKNKLPEEEVSQPTETSKETEAKVSSKNDNDKAVEEIDDQLAENSENDSVPEEIKEYDSYSLEELVDELTVLVKDKPVQNIHNNVVQIKKAFNSKFGELLKKEKEKFLKEGGNIVDFQYKNPIKSTYNSILYDYKIKKSEYYAKQDEKLKNNYEQKLELIEELKQLIDSGETENLYELFKGIQERWRAIGPVPKSKYNDTWRTYHHHVERFYDLLHLTNDFRDLDFKHNLEEKLKLVERAEELAKLKDINESFKELQVLHKLWKEDIGPVGREHREEVWERFSNATKQIHDKRHSYFKNLKSQFDDNVDKKLAIIEKIEQFDYSKNKTRADWQKSIKEIDVLRNKFFEIGQVPKNKSSEIWNKFKNATKEFNSAKNNFFKELKNDQLDNLNKKKLLVERAVELKDSDDWDIVTEVMKQIQAEWKTIGHVPRKYSDKLWNEFKDACNHFFDRLHEVQSEGDKEQLAALKEKEAILEELKKEADKKKKITLEDLKEYIKKWRDIGKVPFDKKSIDSKFNSVLDQIAEKNKFSTKDIELMKFENVVNSYLEQKNYKKLNNEQLFVRKKIDETVREIQQLENNLGFISNATEDNPLFKNVKDNIEEFKEKLSLWEEKLAYLKSLEY